MPSSCKGLVMNTILRSSASHQLSLLAAKEISSLELTMMYIAQIEQWLPKLNAMVVRRFEKALEEARWADENPISRPLHGMPCSIKECFALEGMPQTAGHPDRIGLLAQEDALFVETTDAQGEYSLVGIPEGDWEVRAQLSPNCTEDPGFVPTYWPAEEDPSMAEALSLTMLRPIEVVDFVLARDDDHDQMADRWERRYGLDTDHDDAYEDPDEDGFNNLMEFRMRTDPHAPEGYWVVSRQCGCAALDAPQTWAWIGPLLFAFSRRRASREPHTQAHRADQTSIDSW